jgi:hypothetical protein
MNKFKKTFEAIDMAIASGAVTSVDMLEAIRSKATEDATKRRMLCYILEYHMDEELEMHLMDMMGYDPNFHRIQVDLEGHISF